MRSVPLRVKTAVCITTSSGVPARSRPPMPQYSPSVFSRTTTMSTSSGVRSRSGPGMPGSSRIGRRFTDRSNAWRSGSSMFQSDTWSGTPGKPMAPRKMASLSRIRSSASSSIIRPWVA